MSWRIQLEIIRVPMSRLGSGEPVPPEPVTDAWVWADDAVMIWADDEPISLETAE